jgi:hypothetical protein
MATTLRRQFSSYLSSLKLRVGFIFYFNVIVLMSVGFKRVAV